MLFENKNIFLFFFIYLSFLLIEIFHFGSSLNLILMSESFFSLFIVLKLLSVSFNGMYKDGLKKNLLNLNQIYIISKNVVKLNINLLKKLRHVFYFLFFSILKYLNNLKGLNIKFLILYSNFCFLMFFFKKINNFFFFSKKKFLLFYY